MVHGVVDYAGEMARTADRARRRTPGRRVVTGAGVAAGVLAAAAWLVLAARPSGPLVEGLPFTISGAPERLDPGRPSALDLTVTNPNAFAVRVTALTVSVARHTSSRRCLGDRDFATAPLRRAVDLPAGTSTTLSALGVPPGLLPSVTAPPAGGACAAARVTLRYAGTAVLPH